MELGYIANDALGGFRSLILPKIVAQMDSGAPITALGLQEDDLACGALTGHIEGGLFHITSLYVAPAFRRRGGASRLLQTLEALLELELEQPPANGICAHFTATEDEHEALSAFLESRGFIAETDRGENIYLFTAGQVSPSLDAGEVPAGVTSFARLDAQALELAATAADVPLPQGGLTGTEIERDVSMAMVQGGFVKAFAAFDFSCGGRLTLAAVWSGEVGPTAPLLLLRGALCAIRAKYPADTTLAVQSTNAASCALVAALLPQARPISRSYLRALQL